MKYFWWLHKWFFSWVVSKLTTDDLKEKLGLDPNVPVLYVLPKRSFFDLLVLNHHCEVDNLPLPRVNASDLKKPGQAGYAYIVKPGIFQRRHTPKVISPLEKLIKNLKNDENANVQIVPVSILWGRNPGKGEKSLFKLFFTDDENAGSLQKLFIVFAQGRNVVTHFGQPISLRELVNEGATDQETTRKLRRVLRVHFIRQRNAILGTKLYRMEQVVDQVVRSPSVQKLIEDEVKRGKETRQKVKAKAEAYAREVSADVTWPIVRMFEVLLTRLWNRIFNGVVIRNSDQIKEFAQQAYEIVYVPNHRSHMDYLLVNYTIYKSDLPPPHTAAGINLNFWPVGGFLRRAGGFFIRRRFAGNKLYAAVFNEYLHYLLVQGYPVTFFPEGGRSRTGLLLPPKTGMLSMVGQSLIKNPQRPIVLVPIYIGYDKVVEVGSYLKELSGDAKRKESFGQFLKARKVLRTYYGKAYLGFGTPIFLDRFLAKYKTETNEVDADDRPPLWLNDAVQDLSQELVTRINEAAIVSPVSLISLALLSSPQRALPEEELIGFIEKICALHAAFPYNEKVAFPEGPFKAHLEEAGKLEMFQRFKHLGGDVIYLKEYEAILMSYYKNNVLHLVALPSLVARFFQYQEEMPLGQLVEACREFYPFLREEFFLPWDIDECEDAIHKTIEALTKVKLLVHVPERGAYCRPDVATQEFEYLSTLGRALGLIFERCTITVALLAKSHDKGPLESEVFESQCQKMAQRLAILNGIHTPEALDRSMFKNYVNLLKRMGYLRVDEKERLAIDSKILKVADKTHMLLSADIRHSIERISTSN